MFTPFRHHPTKRLGKRAPKIDPRTLRLRDYVKKVVAPQPPPEVSWIMEVNDWGMLGNDTLGDCVEAAQLHMIQQWTHYAGSELVPSTNDAIRLYSAEGGYVPGEPNTDNGTVILDALNYWRQTGAQVGTAIHKIAAYVSVDWKNQTELQSAIEWFGNVIVGVALPLSAQTQTAWTVPNGGPFNSGSPGSWGGHCLSGKTEIPLLNGSSARLCDLVGTEGLWVYSCTDKGRIVPGYANQFRRTSKKADVYRIILDSGESVLSTADHRFMLRGGLYRAASDLLVGESMMPLYRRLSESSATLGYEECLEPSSQTWRFTHRIVASDLKKLKRGLVVHHLDFNKHNNSPENLQVMTWEDHTRLHAEFPVKDGLLKYAKSEEGRAKSRELMHKLWADPVWSEQQKARLLKDLATKENAANMVAKRDPSYLHELGVNHAENLRLHPPTSDQRKAGWDKRRERLLSDPDFRARWTETCRNNAKSQSAAANHKVVSVEYVGQEDVFDMTVDEHHNFAVGAGIFAHNCIPIMARSPETASCITWGERLKMSHNFFTDYVDECYAVLSQDWIEANGQAPSGLDLAQLQSDLAVVTA